MPKWCFESPVALVSWYDQVFLLPWTRLTPCTFPLTTQSCPWNFLCWPFSWTRRFTRYWIGFREEAFSWRTLYRYALISRLARCVTVGNNRPFGGHVTSRKRPKTLRCQGARWGAIISGCRLKVKETFKTQINVVTNRTEKFQARNKWSQITTRTHVFVFLR